MAVMGSQELNKWKKDLKKGQSEDVFTNDYEKELLKNTIITHAPTAMILLKEGRAGADAFALYNFYCYCASIQKTTSVYATDYFCKRGLSWGSDKFRRSKNLLLKLKIISQKIGRDKETKKILKYYIRVHFLKRNTK